jgi:hypothetical protein
MADFFEMPDAPEEAPPVPDFAQSMPEPEPEDALT